MDSLREELGLLIEDLAIGIQYSSKLTRRTFRSSLPYIILSSAEGMLYWAKDRIEMPNPSEKQPSISTYIQDIQDMDDCDDFLRKRNLDRDFYRYETERIEEYERAIEAERNSLMTTAWRDQEKERQFQSSPNNLDILTQGGNE